MSSFMGWVSPVGQALGEGEMLLCLPGWGHPLF